MLIETISQTDYESAKSQILKALKYTDGIELRLDFLQNLNLDEISNLQALCNGPVVFTLRKESEGGHYRGSEENRLDWINKLATLQPTYFDLEHDTEKDIIQFVSEYTQVILSYHDFNKMPEGLEALYRSMQNPHVSVYKIACYANSSIDMLSMLTFVQEHNNVIGVSMGPYGAEARVLGPIVGNVLDYAGSAAPGQIDAKTMVDTYHYHMLTPASDIFALIGDPVDKSYGSTFHNRIFQHRGQNSIYVRIKLEKKEISSFLNLIKKLPFKGISVTSPLKEDVMPLLDDITEQAKEIKAVNTITLSNGKLCGDNTDGRGALFAIKKFFFPKGKSIIILGAGGAARAIVYEAVKQGAKVSIVNRTEQKALDLASEFGCSGFGIDKLDKLIKESDLLINTTSLRGKALTDVFKGKSFPEYIMDIISNPYKTDLLQLANSEGSFCIYGHEMFIQQGILQQKIWASC